MTREQVQENPALLWTKENYSKDCEDSTTGIISECVF